MVHYSPRASCPAVIHRWEVWLLFMSLLPFWPFTHRSAPSALCLSIRPLTASHSCTPTYCDLKLLLNFFQVHIHTHICSPSRQGPILKHPKELLYSALLVRNSRSGHRLPMNVAWDSFAPRAVRRILIFQSTFRHKEICTHSCLLSGTWNFSLSSLSSRFLDSS